ncbi:hypothetical protein [Gallaecimonas pentaromativorans]|uniref:Uncharacterized protein n=1 Tax=Gallaecimonas pentaromativorans TaxID=584787 RepID=A0A3N1PK69_9GAMM|nr:hypothetical protein [Gallaecimonas pentaromativorans]ROQ27581.1 hypothetical protein EDC28_104232 [Gallaecimonas pentaromativorans]
MRTFLFSLLIVLSLGFIVAPRPAIAGYAAVTQSILPNKIAPTGFGYCVMSLARGFASNDPVAAASACATKSNLRAALKYGARIIKHPFILALVVAAGWYFGDDGEIYSDVSKRLYYVSFRGSIRQHLTESEAKAFIDSEVLIYSESNGYSSFNVTSYPNFSAVTSSFYNSSVYFDYVNSIGETGSTSLSITLLLQGSQSFSEPVSDSDWDDFLNSAIAGDVPGVAKEDMWQVFTNPDGSPNQSIISAPQYNPATVPEMTEALKWYNAGLAQSTDPNAAYYIAPEAMPLVAANAAALLAGNPLPYTDFSGQPATQPVPDDAPTYNPGVTPFPGLTQAQYEQSNNKFGQLAADAVPEFDPSSITDQWSEFDDSVTKIKETDPPWYSDFPSISDLWTIQGGVCTGFPLTVSAGGITQNIQVDSYCQPYSDYFEPALRWFLYVCTGLYLIYMLVRALSGQHVSK